jgi:hypothetical protein
MKNTPAPLLAKYSQSVMISKGANNTPKAIKITQKSVTRLKSFLYISYYN